MVESKSRPPEFGAAELQGFAATALVDGLRIVTRNVTDFAPMGAKRLNPWEPQ